MSLKGNWERTFEHHPASQTQGLPVASDMYRCISRWNTQQTSFKIFCVRYTVVKGKVNLTGNYIPQYTFIHNKS